MTDERLPDYLGPHDLASLGLGLTVEDVRRCRGATELTGLDGRPCWARAEVLALPETGGGQTS
jgi:hypothetical protein